MFTVLMASPEGRLYHFISTNLQPISPMEQALNLTRIGDTIVDAEEFYYNGTEVLARPSLDLPSSVQAQVGVTFQIQGVPTGTKVNLQGNPEMTVGSSGVLDLRFDQAGTFPVRLEPPFPLKRATIWVIVE